ncbi:hypothetical protein [Methylibium rhizosphaerae]|uniref:hypothetical protein n=1 Tax=Methylibium rhizosphaerae TaxID=2570323 RepID=UPI001129111C|nr:hypothetical protein [Methylibium rhizosphaerae]
MPPMSYELLNHLKAIQPHLAELGLRAHIDVADMSLVVLLGKQWLRMSPQFTEERPDGVVYTGTFSPKVRRFIGWRPMYDRTWSISADKLEFKRHLQAQGLPTPAHSLQGPAGLGDVIVKKARSSFSMGIRGPFSEAAARSVALGADGEFFESYVPGDIIKIWYWNEQPVAVEETEMLSVVGDGVSDIGTLVERHVHMLGIVGHELAQYEEFLAYQGRTLRTVLPRDETCAIDFRYNCELPTMRMRDIQVGRDAFHGLEPLLQQAGQSLWATIPGQARQGVVYTVDAMLDKRKRLWFLELNSNPYVHPYVYPHLLRAVKQALQAAHEHRVSA